MTARMRTLALVPTITGAVFLAAWGQDEKNAPPAPLQDSTEASCLLKISFDPQVLPLDGQSIVFLVNSSGVAGEAAAQALDDAELRKEVNVLFEPLGISGAVTESVSFPGAQNAASADPRPTSESPDPMVRAFSQYWGAPEARRFAAPSRSDVVGCEQVIMGRLTVSSPNAPKARAIMNRVTERLQGTFEKASQSEQVRFHSALESTQKRAELAKMKLAELHAQRRKLLESTSLNDLSRDAILEMSRRLETERQDTAVKLEALKARQEAVRERTARTENEREAAAARETKALEERLAVLRNQLERLKALETKAAQRDVETVEAALRKAQDELAARAQAMGPAGLGRLLEEMTNQLSATSIDLTEAEVRLKTLQENCMRMRDYLAKSDEYELQVGLELPLARSAYENARRREEELRIRIENLRPPSVVVLGE